MKKVTIMVLAVFAMCSFAVAQADKEITSEMHADLTCDTCHDEKPESKTPPVAKCFDCHESYDAVAELTAKFDNNPHDSHKGEPDCSTCHSMHAESRLSCNDCHSFDNMKLK